ncbi:MAG: hypothetical protein LBR91_01480 [Puniceicoccales bacterium]|jgi:hypothetical protein|nr:hypothetical protein [Puniceicoccales bacterium]
MDASKNTGNIVADPTRFRTSQATNGVALADRKHFLRIPKSEFKEPSTESGSVFARATENVTVEKLSAKTNEKTIVELIDVEANNEKLEQITNNSKLAPYLRSFNDVETRNDTKIALAMINSAAAREIGAMESANLGPTQLTEKYTKFVKILGNHFNEIAASVKCDAEKDPPILGKNQIQKLKLMEKIVASLLRFVPGSSIGSLSNGTASPDQDQISKLQKMQKELKNKQEEIGGLSESTPGKEAIRNKLANQLKGMSTNDVNTTVNTIVGNADEIGSAGKSLNSSNSLIKDFRIIQFLATGVDILEELEAEAQKSPEANEAKNLYCALTSNDGPLGTYDNSMELMKTVRKSGFFMEYSYKKLDEKIADTFADQIAAWPDGISDDGKKEIKRIVAEKLEQLRNETGVPDKVRGGFRGRDISTKIGGHPKPHKEIFSEQGPAEIRGKPVGNFLELNGLDTRDVKFFTEVRDDGCFNRMHRPQQSATPDVIELIRVAMLNNPSEFFQNAIRENGGDTASQLPEKLAKFDWGKLQTALLDIEFETANGPAKNNNQPWKIRDLVEHPKNSDTTYVSKCSFAASVIDNGLQTFCSVSGTTTDIVVGMVAQLGGDPDGKKAMEDKLRPLVELVKAENIDTNKLAGPDFGDFKNLFLSVSLYMQSGQYHTASEVLAGLYCVALNLCGDQSAMDVTKFGENFEKLCVAFQSDPAKFFPAVHESKAA